MSQFAPIERLFATNSQWASDVEQHEPGFFAETAKGQSPKVLWIGCADSRVPETTLTGSRPGDIFVHRNIANQFHPNDDNVLAVLAYAVDFLGVEHVVIVGHTECGGAAACFNASGSGVPGQTIPSLPTDAPLNKWLTPLTILAASLQLSSAPAAEVLPILVEENVKMQVENLAKSSVIVNAWKNKSGRGKDVWIHGWVYDLAHGKLKDLGVTRGPSV
ncbi:carbonic anhydrase [Marasmius fiardii PR-910]|nr:carbonic anhydrase [Marasmius fiardii PR-910]